MNYCFFYFLFTIKFLIKYYHNFSYYFIIFKYF